MTAPKNKSNRITIALVLSNILLLALAANFLGLYLEASKTNKAYESEQKISDRYAVVDEKMIKMGAERWAIACINARSKDGHPASDIFENCAVKLNFKRER